MDVNDTIESDNDLMQYKKERLMFHNEFINQMIRSTKDEYQKKWKTMHDCINSVKKK